MFQDAGTSSEYENPNHMDSTTLQLSTHAHSDPTGPANNYFGPDSNAAHLLSEVILRQPPLQIVTILDFILIPSQPLSRQHASAHEH
jgi:hypothetical protein